MGKVKIGKKKKKDVKPSVPSDADGKPLEGEELEAYHQEQREEAARQEAEAARLKILAEKEEGEAIMRRAAEKAEERRREAAERAERANKAQIEKERRELEAAQFLEMKRMKAEEDYERKRISDIAKAHRAELRRIRQKKIDDRNDFVRRQGERPVLGGLGEEIRGACARGETEAVIAYIDDWEASPVLAELDSDGWDVVTWLCKKGDFTAAKHLMHTWVNEWDTEEDLKKTWSERLEKRDPYGQTLLMFASIAGATDLVRFLISKGAQKNAVNEDGFNAITFAAYHGKSETVRVLVELQCNIETRTIGQKTPLQCAVVGGDKGTIEVLRWAEDLRGVRS